LSEGVTDIDADIHTGPVIGAVDDNDLVDGSIGGDYRNGRADQQCGGNEVDPAETGNYRQRPASRAAVDRVEDRRNIRNP
jgi:hypothetical protein